MQAATDEVSTGNSNKNQTETKRLLKAAIKESLEMIMNRVKLRCKNS